MKSNDVVRAAMKNDNITQAQMAEKLGYQSQAGVSNALNRQNGVPIATFIKMMNTMGYDVVVRRGKDEMVVTE